MNTKEFIENRKMEVKRLQIRSMLSDDPAEIKKIGKKIAAKEKFISRLERLQGLNRAWFDVKREV